jgi:poly(ADP-ribose) glycohydrolase
VLALDAIRFKNFKSQFNEINVRRELVKCICGFKAEYETNQNNDINLDKISELKQTTIATGNWGCGAFNGDIELKCNLDF